MNGQMKRPGQKNVRNPNWMPILWIALLMMLFFSFFKGNTSSEVLNISYSDFRKYVSDGQVAQVTFEGDQLTGQFKKPVKKGPSKKPVAYKEFKTVMPPIAGSALLDFLEQNYLSKEESHHLQV